MSDIDKLFYVIGDYLHQSISYNDALAEKKTTNIYMIITDNLCYNIDHFQIKFQDVFSREDLEKLERSHLLEEFRSTILRRFGSVRATFDRFDANKDKELSLREWALFITKHKCELLQYNLACTRTCHLAC